jgi:pilus assembly protein CpaE
LLDCVLISSDEAFRHAVMGAVRQSAVRAKLALDVSASADAIDRETVDQILELSPKVAFIDLGPRPTGLGGIKVLTREAPDLLLIVAGPNLTAEGLLTIMRSGVSEYLPRPISQDETVEAFTRVKRRVKTEIGAGAKTSGRVSTVFSAKGGTGVTTVATNLAVALRIQTEADVLLLDLDPTLGTASVAMGVQPRYTYLDVIRNFHRIDEELFLSYLEEHESGVRVLASPFSLLDFEPPGPEDLRKLVSLGRQYFDHVVIDGGSSVSPELVVTLQDSDEKILVVTPDLPSLRNLKQAQSYLARTNGRGPSRVVLNQFKEGVGLSLGDIEDGLGQRLAAVFEKDDNRVLQSINLGRPEVLTGKSKLARSLLAFGGRLAGEGGVEGARKGLFDRLFRSSKETKKQG